MLKRLIKWPFIPMFFIIIISLSSCNLGNTLPDYNHHLFGDYTFSRTSSLNQCLCSDYTGEIILDLDYVYSYAHDSVRYIAFHNIELTDNNSDAQAIYQRKFNNTVYGVASDKVILFDAKNADIKEFSDKGDLYAFCLEKDIVLSDWFYTSSHESIASKSIELINGYYFEDRGDTFGQSIQKGNMPLFDGIISEYATDSNKFLAFHLVVDNNGYDIEYPVFSNKSLNISDEPISKLKINWLIEFPIYYDNYVLYNSVTEETLEFDNKNSLMEFASKNYITLNEWSQIK